jgi:hypothetical protein
LGAKGKGLSLQEAPSVKVGKLGEGILGHLLQRIDRHGIRQDPQRFLGIPGTFFCKPGQRLFRILQGLGMLAEHVQKGLVGALLEDGLQYVQGLDVGGALPDRGDEGLAKPGG